MRTALILAALGLAVLVYLWTRDVQESCRRKAELAVILLAQLNSRPTTSHILAHNPEEFPLMFGALDLLMAADLVRTTYVQGEGQAWYLTPTGVLLKQDVLHTPPPLRGDYADVILELAGGTALAMDP